MDRMKDYEVSPSSSPTPKDEPRIENDYQNRTEIESPNPSIATPSIPSEMPAR